MKIPSDIAKRYELRANSPEAGLSWFISRERASLVAWLVCSLYTGTKKAPVGVVVDALADVDVDEEFVRAAAKAKPPFVTLDSADKRYFAFLCQTIRESVRDDYWTGDGAAERWVGPDLSSLNAQINDLVRQLRPLIAQRDVLTI